MLFTPGNNWRMVQKAKDLPADAIIIDLEDAVPITEKETARVFIEEGVQLIKTTGKQVFIRVNSFSTGLIHEDLKYAIIRDIDGIILSKTESKEDILQVDMEISCLETERDLQNGKISIIPLLETAKGLVNIEEIIDASERVIAICFGAMDFTRDMGTTQTKEGSEIFLARSMIALISNAYGIQSIDTPWFDIVDEEGLVNDTLFAKQLGFKGKLIIHPDHIEPVNSIFSPTKEEIVHAERIVKSFNEAKAKGLGAISINGKMIDIANFKQAEALLDYAKLIKER